MIKIILLALLGKLALLDLYKDRIKFSAMQYDNVFCWASKAYKPNWANWANVVFCNK